MAETVASPLAETRRPGAVVNAGVVAMLRSGVVLHQTAAAWMSILQARVFADGPARPDKEEMRDRRRLASQPAMLFLQIIWRESDFVQDLDLAAAGMERGFCGDETLNCHALAMETAADPRDVGKLDKRVRAIVAAAVRYGLVYEEKDVRGSRLTGTLLLHDVMAELHQQIQPSIREAARLGIES